MKLKMIFSIVIFFSTCCFSEEKPKEKSDEVSEELDVSRLEGQYWVAKDSQFKVVQNRLYKKEKRFSLLATWGPMINDQFSDGKGLLLGASYFLNERWGVELSYLTNSPKDNTLTTEFKERFGVVPNHNKFDNYIGISGTWVPIYAKASLLDKKIIYYDLALSLGAGFAQYEQQFTDQANKMVSAPALSIDVTQQFYISHRWALRFSYMIRLYSEEIKDSRSPFSIREESYAQTSFLQLGIVFFFKGAGQ